MSERQLEERRDQADWPVEEKPQATRPDLQPDHSHQRMASVVFGFTSILASSMFDDDDFFHRRVLVRLVRVSAASVVTEEGHLNLVLVLLETFLADSTEDERGIVEAPDCFFDVLDVTLLL